ncbi:MAG: response regulator [Nitrospirae bacterium]|nr:response regulator [Nitrospirota bacterium]MBF0541749.1 response regulator [Nitrospirota bacterium]
MRPAIINWYKTFSWTTLRSDLIAGITVAPVVIPQSMAYAQLAGVPAYYGLYAALVPPIIAAMFGSNNQLSTGPVAMSSLMSAAIISTLARSGSAEFIEYSILLALIVGIFILLIGLLRLGIVLNLLSHPVVVGFTNAAAIIIGTSQLSKFFNVFVGSSEHSYETVINVVKEAIHNTHYPSFLIALLAIAIIAVFKKINPKLPGVLIAIIVTTVIAWATGFENNKTVDISSIIDTKTVDSIKEFNKATAAINEFSEKKVDELLLLKDAQEQYGRFSPAVLDLKIYIDKLNQSIHEYQETTHYYRKMIREFRYIKVNDNGVLKFYRKDNLPSNVKDDGVSWHLKIEHNPIDPKAVFFMGGGEVVGVVPKGIPKFSMPKFNLSVIYDVIPGSIIISLLGMMEIISVIKSTSVKTGQRVDLNQEMIGQGLSNIAGSFSNCCVVSGSFARTAVNLQSGALTGMSTVFTSGIVALTLIFFTPLLYYLPQPALAAVIAMAVFKLMDIRGIIHIWRAQKYDGSVCIVTFISTIFFAPHIEHGIIFGFILTMIFHLYQTMKPRVAELSTNTATTSELIDNNLQDAELNNLDTCDFITIIRFDGALIFANTSYLEDQVLNCLIVKPRLSHIIFVGDGINYIDTTGEEMLKHLIVRLREKNINVSFCGLKDQVSKIMKVTGLDVKITDKNIYNTLSHALLSIYPKTHQHEEGGYEETDCPLKKLVYYKSIDTAKRSRVLLVDDEKDFTRLLTKRMQVRSLDTTTASDGMGALDLVETERPDVVVLDLNMPGIDGLEILRIIKTVHPQIEVIILTGQSSEKKIQTAFELGAFAFLKKPIDINILVKTVEDAYRKIAAKSLN